MTTVAWDGSTLATDSQMTAGNFKGRSLKIIRLDNGGLFGCAGDWLKARAAAAAIDGKGVAPDDEACFGLYVDPAGKPFSCEGKPFGLVPLKAPCGAGSGRDIAVGAMAAGKTSEEAVKIASRFDCYTSGKVQTAKVVKAPRK